jgi:PiT family inorganic phosphate transporter
VITTIVIIVFLALLFDFINGFHDTANAIATSVSTKALTPKFAVFYAAVANFAGAMVYEAVAKSIGGKVANPANIPHGMEIVIAALLSAIIWNLLTWYFGIPSSSSHTLIGSMAGAVIAGAGFGYLNWNGFGQIIRGLILSPFLAFAVGFVLLFVIKWIVLLLGNGSPSKFNRGFRTLQIFSAGWQAYNHGGNDAQKAMGIIVFALVAGGLQPSVSHIPLWVKIAAATAMALGTAVGGWKIIKTVGSKIIKIEPMNGFASDLSSSIVLQTATVYGIPVSTTHVITSSIIGSGTALRPKSIGWSVVGKMILTWIITIPISMVLAFLIFKALFFYL